MAFDSRLLSGIQVLVAAVETGSFVRAAASLGITQSGVLHARVAAFNKAKATLTLAQQEFAWTAKLVVSETATRELYDQRRAVIDCPSRGHPGTGGCEPNPCFFGPAGENEEWMIARDTAALADSSAGWG